LRVLAMPLLLFTLPAAAQYQPQDPGSTIQFRIKNLGFNVTGTLRGLAGKIRFNPAEPDKAAFDVTVDANTINTDNGMRDDHLRQSSYFDVQHFPAIRLVSDRIAWHKKGTYLFSGQLTIKNHTKELSFPFSVTETDGGYRFRGSFTINRRDFEIGGLSTISDELEVTLDVMAK
ncbi:MAG TPA: YceI family protein, partial [Puia sp.]|nr:YceI family protein [Puia sp.]